MTVDELCARELLDRLANTEPPPSRVDVGLAHRRGRRILFWRRAAAPGASAMAVVAVVGLISTNVITLGPSKDASAAGPVHPRTAFSALAPYASFDWLPTGFTLSAGSSVHVWSSDLWASSRELRSGLTPPAQTTQQSVQVNASSPATHMAITLTVNTANSCTFGTAPPLTGKMEQYRKKLRKEHPNWPPEPYQLICHYDNTGGGRSVGEVIGKVNGSPAYGGGGLVWQYAKGSWAQLDLGVSGAVSNKERRALLTEWAINDSASVNAMLLRIADHIRYGDRSESFAFRLNDAPKDRQYATTYAEYGGRLLNTTLWLGQGWSTNANGALITVTPASKPSSCGFVRGQSRYVTLDGTQFTVRTMWVPQGGSLQGLKQQVLCGYVNGLQVYVGVSLDPLDSYLSSFTGTNAQDVAVTVFRHMALLGTNPAGWTTHPLGKVQPGGRVSVNPQL